MEKSRILVGSSEGEPLSEWTSGTGGTGGTFLGLVLVFAEGAREVFGTLGFLAKASPGFTPTADAGLELVADCALLAGRPGPLPFGLLSWILCAPETTLEAELSLREPLRSFSGVFTADESGRSATSAIVVRRVDFLEVGLEGWADTGVFGFRSLSCIRFPSLAEGSV